MPSFATDLPLSFVSPSFPQRVPDIRIQNPHEDPSLEYLSAPFNQTLTNNLYPASLNSLRIPPVLSQDSDYLLQPESSIMSTLSNSEYSHPDTSFPFHLDSPPICGSYGDGNNFPISSSISSSSSFSISPKQNLIGTKTSGGGIEKKKKDKENRNLFCFNCKTVKTPLWRRTMDRNYLLCNACGKKTFFFLILKLGILEKRSLCLI